MTAAVADFRPREPAEGKIKKSGRTSLELELEPTVDVLASLAAQRRDGQTLVGFAAEHGERAVDCARKKLTEKGLDAVVVNDISREDIGFDVDVNEVDDPHRGRQAPRDRPVRATCPQDGGRGGDPRCRRAFARRGMTAPDASRSGLWAPPRCYARSRAFVPPIEDRPADASVVPRVGARPLFLRKE